MKQEMIISKDGETMIVSDENLIKVAALLGVTPKVFVLPLLNYLNRLMRLVLLMPLNLKLNN